MDLVIKCILTIAILLIVNKVWCFWSRSKVCLVGKTAVITGGASGMGYQTALTLASKGCRVIIADVANLSPILKQLLKETQNTNIVGKQVDLQSLASVRKLAADILATETRLDILICNAGVTEYGNGKYTEDGLQRVMQINYFSHFLLTHLLLDLLKKSQPSRIIFTSSIAAYISLLTEDTLNPKPEYFSTLTNIVTEGCYSNSKLALAAAAKLFGEKLKGTGVTANAVHPGGVNTSLYYNNLKVEKNPLVLIAWAIIGIYGKNSEEGAQTIIHLAQSEEVKNITSTSFYEGMRVPRPFPINNDNFCHTLWEKSIEYTKLEPHEVKC